MSVVTQSVEPTEVLDTATEIEKTQLPSGVGVAAGSVAMVLRNKFINQVNGLVSWINQALSNEDWVTDLNNYNFHGDTNRVKYVFHLHEVMEKQFPEHGYRCPETIVVTQLINIFEVAGWAVEWNVHNSRLTLGVDVDIEVA